MHIHMLGGVYVTADASAPSTAGCLLQHFGRFGAPRHLRSDNELRSIVDVIL